LGRREEAYHQAFRIWLEGAEVALFDSNQFNISRGLSYLRALGLEWGLAANFGKKTLELTGPPRAAARRAQLSRTTSR
jgi:hypothetical protein